MLFSTRIVLIVAWISYTGASEHGPVETAHGEVVSKPALERIYPEYGPRYGGTRLTLIGRLLTGPSDTVTVTLKDGGEAYPCRIEESRADHIVVLTPNYKGKEDSVELLLEVSHPNGSHRHALTSTFLYRPDPVVHSIKPDSTILAGGVTLTVTGMNLDSAQRPLLTSSVLRHGQLLKRNDNQQAYFIDSTSIKFKIPGADDVIQTRHNVTGVIPDVAVLVGFLFDGLQQYANYSQLRVESNPIVERWEPRLKPFSCSNDDFIAVNVSWGPGLDISEDDMAIMIGARRCLNLRRDGNQLHCDPPSVPEPVILNGPESLSKPIVTVRIGYQQTEIGTIIYGLSGGLHVIIIVMISIFGVVFFISMLFGCIAICSGRRKDGKAKHKERSSISYVPVDDLDEMARRRSRVRLSKDSNVDIPQQYQRNRSNSSTSSTSSPSPDKGDQQPLHKIEEQGETGGKSKVIFTDMSKK